MVLSCFVRFSPKLFSKSLWMIKKRPTKMTTYGLISLINIYLRHFDYEFVKKVSWH